MDNDTIADKFSLLSKLMEIHADNSFKAKSYGVAAFNIEKLPVQLAELPQNKIFSLPGVGEAIGKKIIEVLETGQLSALDNYLEKTPPGILEMLRIKGLGPKKICTIWKELEVETIGELLYACSENRLLLYKGFGAKTQANIKDSIEFYLSNTGCYLFAQVESYGAAWEEKLKDLLPNNTFLQTGEFRRHTLTIDKLQWITDATPNELLQAFANEIYETSIEADVFRAKGPENVLLEFFITPQQLRFTRLFETSGSNEFVATWKNRFGWDELKQFDSEESIFTEHGVAWVEPYLREKPAIIDKAAAQQVPEVITTADIRAIIHSHSDWSDGGNTIAQMAEAAIQKGFEYLVISDHSKSAFYAKGLFPDRIKAQHQLIDELNEKYKGFKIFKSIESDILNDGSLDYDDDILASFDLVITSVHSNLKMSEEKAMTRLLKAIANPYTTILGHMTGRLLLSRHGYPVDHKAIVDACAEHNVVIELNAHPRRLDMDWNYIDYALEKGVLISIDPDAHAVEAFSDIRYGVLAAQKGGLTKDRNLSSFTLEQFESFLQVQQQKRK
ncbi:DNA polymerase/3'-5' exonuclease PolX [Segetibacter sp. 3557_3]|uniref:DNA polymerase/3'-5' exonuclease PolX n=1 Tax=Segetibacter sp. 3557_3 TaxID=2547429 RepID=UPI001058D2A1|nr:DNA polymerase/3'-5' exonuclease PolX [Segetibacter sp. 3557_3]TDH27955.1 DNA polymerase/3'-5' exonuclease PolX [Segetibacter sp. 3557_3]